MRTGSGTFVPEYVKSYDVAQFIGSQDAASAVADIGAADSVVTFVRESGLTFA